MTARQNPERRWATGVLVVSGLISLSFNTRHAFYATTLPAPLALGYGAGPVVLAAAQSHVVALQASRGDLVGGWRKAATFGLVIGALALSFLGIYDLLRVAVPDPIPGTPFNEPAILTPVVVDLMAIAALHELLRPVRAVKSLTDALPGPVAHATPADPLTAGERPVVVTTPWGGLSTSPVVPVGQPAKVVDRAVETALDDQSQTVPDNHPGLPATTTSNDRPAAARKTTRKTGKGRPTTEENDQAIAAYRSSVAARRPLSERALAEQFGRSKGWARDRIREAGPLLVGGHRNDQSAGDADDHEPTTETTAKESTG